MIVLPGSRHKIINSHNSDVNRPIKICSECGKSYKGSAMKYCSKVCFSKNKNHLTHNMVMAQMINKGEKEVRAWSVWYT